METLFLILMGVGGAVSLALAVYAWRQGTAAWSIAYAAMMAMVAWWSFGYALELMATDMPAKAFWNQLVLLGRNPIGVGWLVFALAFTNLERWVNWRIIPLLLVAPTLITISAWTNEPTGLYGAFLGLEQAGPFLVLKRATGPLFWLQAAYNYVLILVGVVLVFGAFTRWAQPFRGQAMVLLIGVCFPLLANLLTKLGVFPLVGVELTPLSFSITGLVMAYGLFRHGLLSLVPVARDAVFESIGEGVIVLDARGCVVDLNPAARRIVDSPASEPIGQPASKLLSQWSDWLEKVDDMAHTAEGIVLGNHGAERVYRIRLSPLYDRRGKISGRLIVLSDVTELKRAEETLVESQRRLAEIIDHLPHATFVIDAQGMVLFWNRAAEEMTGVKAEEMVGKGDHEYAIPWYGERRMVLIDHALQPHEEIEAKYAFVKRRGDYLVAETYVRRPHGGGAYVLATASVLRDTKGEIAGAIEIVSDITEHKEMEEALHNAKDQAEAATQAKSAFLATMSHEIRTPMNAIIGMTGLLLDTPLNPQQRDFAETIRGSGDALLTIINDILDFSKIEAGRMELEKAPFNLRDCVESALDLMATRAAEKRLDIGYLIEAHTPSDFYGDVTRLRQILLNLLGNAIKFTEEGEVVISVTAKLPEGTQGNGEIGGTGENHGSPVPTGSYELHFAVRDTGIGIPGDRMGRLFQSFSQVDASTTRKYGGTGLGLTISKRLAEMMGGAMWVESEVGKGSTFHFTIVTETAKSTKPVYLQGEQPSLQHKRVLVVDDNATNRTILDLQTRAWGMLPVLASSGREALHLIQRGEAFDLAILDMHMPEMDGMALAQEIRRHRDADALPMIMLTSLGRQEANVQLDLFAAFLTKPVKASQLYNTLVEVFVGESACLPRQGEKESEFDPTLGSRLPLRILLAEDNIVNQKLALLILERLGYRADVVANGQEVLDALNRQLYDVVLMDMQMPEMDGLQATRSVRDSFQVEAQPHIIAMTANAMQGDREACLAAGMNDYVSKPIVVKELIGALSRVPRRSVPAVEGTAGRSHEPPAAPVSLDESTSPLDWAVLEALAQGLDRETADVMVRELIELFLADAPAQMESVRGAVAAASAGRLREAAHGLKGAGANMGARPLAAVCLELEKLGRSGSTEGAVELLAQLEHEFQRTCQALEMVMQQGA